MLAAPAMGARFAMYQLDLAPGGGTTQSPPENIESFFYVVAGECRLEAGGRAHPLRPGGYAYFRPGARMKLAAAESGPPTTL